MATHKQGLSDETSFLISSGSDIITTGTSAEYAYDVYVSLKEKIQQLEYECASLVEKYHAEMRHARIPPQFQESSLDNLFSDDAATKRFARSQFLSLCFSEDFLKKHKKDIGFLRAVAHGHCKTAVSILLSIGDYDYDVEIPIPQNITSKDDMARLVGRAQFRVDRFHKSKRNEFYKEYEAVQMPTYDWKKCFESIERLVGNAMHTSRPLPKKK